MAGKLRVTQVKSTIGHIARNRGTARALGLKHIGDTVEVPDNPATRGMVRQIRFLVSVETLEAATTQRAPARKASAEGEIAAESAAASTPAVAAESKPRATPKPRKPRAPSSPAQEKA